VFITVVMSHLPKLRDVTDTKKNKIYGASNEIWLSKKKLLKPMVGQSVLVVAMMKYGFFAWTI